MYHFSFFGIEQDNGNRKASIAELVPTLRILSGGDHVEGHRQARHRGSLPRPDDLCLWTPHEQCGGKVDSGLQGLARGEQQKRDQQGGDLLGRGGVHAGNVPNPAC